MTNEIMIARVPFALVLCILKTGTFTSFIFFRNQKDNTFANFENTDKSAFLKQI